MAALVGKQPASFHNVRADGLERLYRLDADAVDARRAAR
jgi:hypothetical protein